MADNESPSSSRELEREFELERMILFSDAIFAIAITLMAVDIKWPNLPQSLKGVDISTLMHPTIIQFVIFLITFSFVGRAWKSHLRLFRQLQRYNTHLLSLNLLYLLFIVIFPFTASGLVGHTTDQFPYPLMMYVINLLGLGCSDFLLTRYMFKVAPELATPGEPEEKASILMRSKLDAIAPVSTFLVMLVIAIRYPGNAADLGYAFFLHPIILIAGTKRMKRKMAAAKAAAMAASSST